MSDAASPSLEKSRGWRVAPKLLRSFVIALSGALLFPPHSLGAQHALSVNTSPERNVHTMLTPGDDFFAYANDAWLTSTTIPSGKTRWSARDAIYEATQLQLQRLLDQAEAAPHGSLARKVADFRTAWRDTATIEARGRLPLQPLLDNIDGIPDKDALVRSLGRHMRADVDPLNWGIYRSSTLLGLSVEASIHGEKQNVAFLLQGGLGLPDRDYYVNDEPRMQAVRAQYVEYIETLLSFSGADHARERAERVFALEVAIAKSHATQAQSAVDRNADSVWTRADFARRAPGIDWPTFLRAAGLGDCESLVVWQPSAIEGAAALIASVPLDTWKDYLRFHAVSDVADVLPHAVAEHARGLRAMVANEAQQKSRDTQAHAAVLSMMSDAIGKLYAQRYFSARQKARVDRIARDVTAAFIRRVEHASWMTPATQGVALAKLRTVYVGMGTPDHWPSYADLVIDSRDAVGNVHRIWERNFKRALGRIGKPIDWHEWWITPHSANALLIFQQNAYEFSAALLQPPKFDSTASDAALYGSVGALVAHDVTHFVDVLGKEYGIDGAMRRWWTSEDDARYDALTDPLIRQFAAYHPFPDAAVDGKLTLRENIADLAGLAAAFDAHRLTLGARVRDTAFVHARDREFFIAFAQSWRTKMTDEAMRAQLANDHAPDNYRIATVRNMDAWYEAFDVRPGQRLYLAPNDRVRVW